MNIVFSNSHEQSKTIVSDHIPHKGDRVYLGYKPAALVLDVVFIYGKDTILVTVDGPILMSDFLN